MLKNYFKIAWRSIKKNKIFSVINILGLGLGMAGSLLILLWVLDERSVDNYHLNGDLLYSIYQQQYVNSKVEAGYGTPGLLAAELKRVIPEVEYATASFWDFDITFEAGNKIIKQNGGYAGADFFKMFSYPLVEGDPASALSSPLGIAISDKMAKNFFGSVESAMGKTLRCENRKDFTITAVFADPPENTSQKFDYIINWSVAMDEYGWMKDWTNIGPGTNIMLRAGANPQLAEVKITKFLDNYIKKDEAKNVRFGLGMQRFGDVYLHSNFKNGVPDGGRIEYVKLFSIIAIFILFIACINFMNLTTARSVKRAKEIGVRKAAGALRSGLIGQFLSEAMLITVLAVLITLASVFFLMPYFNEFTGKQIRLPFSHVTFWMYIISLILVTGFVSGSYPALFLSSLKPINILKGPLKSSYSSTLFRKGLVVFQFVLSITLIIGTFVIAQQVNYIQKMNLGYDRENLIYIPLEGDLARQYALFKQQALAIPGVKQISRISAKPTNIDNATGSVEWTGKEPNSYPKFTQASVGYDFVKTMNLKLLQGRDFSKNYPSDSSGYILNEAALKIINYKSPIGMPLTFWERSGNIIGVLEDFHFMSLHDPIKPLILRFGETDNYGNVMLRTTPGNTKQVLIDVEKICKNLNPQFSFSYSFSDEEYQKLYKNEGVISSLSRCFAFLAIFISCMGLLGLAMFTTEQRMKEITIRKLLGASVFSLFTLLINDFILLVIISLVIASPIAWWGMDFWLQNYAYRIQIGWWVFSLSWMMALLIAVATVSFQAIKAAMLKPAQTLRSE